MTGERKDARTEVTRTFCAYVGKYGLWHRKLLLPFGKETRPELHFFGGTPRVTASKYTAHTHGKKDSTAASFGFAKRWVRRCDETRKGATVA